MVRRRHAAGRLFVGRLFLCEMGHQLRAPQRQRPQDRKYDFNLGLSLDAVQPVVNRSWAKSALWFRLHYGIRLIFRLPRRFLCFWCRQLSPRTLAHPRFARTERSIGGVNVG
jgi:hypothetical protein